MKKTLKDRSVYCLSPIAYLNVSVEGPLPNVKMSMCVSFFALYLTVLSIICSFPSHAVYNGQRATEYLNYKPMAHFVWKKDRHHHCGGTLITWQHVITAAHCHPSPKDHYVIIGARKLNDLTEGVKLRFEKVYVCNSYDCTFHYNDLTIVRLEPGARKKLKAANILPMEIEWKASSLELNTELMVYGFGARKEQEEPSSSRRLYVGWSYTCSNRICALQYSLSECRRESICLDGRSSSACKGDSGGPVMLPGKRGFWPTLVGVVSGGEVTDDSCIDGELWHAVNVEAHIDWITDCVGSAKRWCYEGKCPALEDGD